MSRVQTIRADLKVNPHEPKIKSVLLSFRLAHQFRVGPPLVRKVSLPYIVLYRLITEWVVEIMLCPRTTIGPGLTVHHGVGLVANDGSVIGSGEVLRQNVTNGRALAGGTSPVIKDLVTFGSGSMVLGRMAIGRGADIGAGAIVRIEEPDYGVIRLVKSRVFAPLKPSGFLESNARTVSSAAGFLAPRRDCK